MTLQEIEELKVKVESRMQKTKDDDDRELFWRINTFLFEMINQAKKIPIKLSFLTLFILLFSCKMPPYPCDTPLARLSNVKFFSAVDCGREGDHHVLFVVWQQTDKEIDWLYFTGQQWSTNWSDALMIDDADSCKLKKIYRQWERSQMLDRDRWDSIHNVVHLPPKDTIGSDVIEERIKKDHGDNWQLSVDSSDAWLVDSSRIKAIAWFQKITNPVKKRKAKRLKGKYWRGQIHNTPYKAYDSTGNEDVHVTIK